MKNIVSGLSLAVLAIIAAPNANAQQWEGRETDGNYVAVSVIGDQQGTLPVFRSRNQYFVAGDYQERYSVRLRNLTNQRVMAVVSLDGVNVITGQTASVEQTGYVLNPWGETIIEGWRKSPREVSRFYFTPKNNSYAYQTGRGGNEGVIGVAVFQERSVRVRPRVMSDQAAEMSAPQAARSASPALGTGHGEREYSYSYRVPFQRLGGAVETVRIEYDTYENLEQRGVINRYRNDYRNPQPFPQDRYVPDPGYWR